MTTLSLSPSTYAHTLESLAQAWNGETVFGKQGIALIDSIIDYASKSQVGKKVFRMGFEEFVPRYR